MEGDQVPGIKKGKNEIEEVSLTLNQLVMASRNGEWETVWSILGTHDNPEKDYLLNAIPQTRRWGVLHQAVYWQNPDVLRQVLKFPTCDTKTKAKKCMSECGPTDRMTALQIANEYNYTDMASILSDCSSNQIASQEIQTFQPFDGYCDDKGLSLISLTLASYKEAFHPSRVDPSKSVMSILKDVFNDINTVGERWKTVKGIVADAVFPVSVEKATDITNCETKKSFFSQVIRAYTNEDNTIYAYLNMAFRRQRQNNYMPSGDDLAMGPYCVMYQMLLLFWEELPAENRTTYRTMKLTREDVDKYVTGTRFVWQSIVSSAVDKDHTHTFPSMGLAGDIQVIFTIDNSKPCVWQPRNIEAHADFPETERTYPAGAKFFVTARSETNNEKQIHLRLI